MEYSVPYLVKYRFFQTINYYVMNILLISSLLSNNLLDDIRKITGQYPAYAVQKFYRVLAAGLCKNKSNVTVLSNPPAFMSEKRERFLNYQNDSEDGVNYRYVPFLNFSVIRHLCLFIYTFLYVFGYGFKKRKDKAIVCDILCYSTCLAALLAAKITGVKIVGLVTDLPWLVDEEGKVSLKCEYLELLPSGILKSMLITFS